MLIVRDAFPRTLVGLLDSQIVKTTAKVLGCDLLLKIDS